jgi:hypothetical protein
MLKKDEVMHYYDGYKWQRREARVVTRNVLQGVVKNLTHMIDTLHVHNNIVPKDNADSFMGSVGEALEIDFTCEDYDYNYEKNDEEKKRISDHIIRYIKDFIYDKTKEMFPTDIIT